MVDLQAKKVKQETEVIPGLVRQARRTLVTASSHKFPFDLFPDTIRVEEDKVTIITRKFIWSSEVHGVDVKDIVNVFINTSPFYAQLVLVSKTFGATIAIITVDQRRVYVKRIIEGLRTLTNNQVDTSVYPDELMQKLEERVKPIKL